MQSTHFHLLGRFRALRKTRPTSTPFQIEVLPIRSGSRLLRARSPGSTLLLPARSCTSSRRTARSGPRPIRITFGLRLGFIGPADNISLCEGWLPMRIGWVTRWEKVRGRERAWFAIRTLSWWREWIRVGIGIIAFRSAESWTCSGWGLWKN
jgi:hypothetical protein